MFLVAGLIERRDLGRECVEFRGLTGDGRGDSGAILEGAGGGLLALFENLGIEARHVRS